jgi:hypothetical protein
MGGGGYSLPNSPGAPLAADGFYYVQCGAAEHRKMVKHARTPPLPPKMRNSQTGTPNPHFGERPSPSKTRAQPACKAEKQHEYIAWKYMGDTDNVCGCYSAKIRADTPRNLQSRTVSKFPVDHARARLRMEKEPEDVHKSNAWKKLFRESLDRSLDRKADMPVMRCVKPADVEGIDTDFDENEVVDRSFQSKGKWVPLRASALCSRIHRP